MQELWERVSRVLETGKKNSGNGNVTDANKETSSALWRSSRRGSARCAS